MKLIFAASLMFSFHAIAADSVDITPPSRPGAVEVVSYLDNRINLKWIGSGDDGWDGQATKYLGRWSATEIQTEEQWQLASDLNLGLTSPSNAKRIRARTLATKLGDRGFFMVRAQDEAGNLSELTPSLAFHIVNPFDQFGLVLTRLPDGAEAMGNEAAGQMLYGCIGQHEKDLVPGKFGVHLGYQCVIARGSSEIYVPNPAYRLFSKSNGLRWMDSASAVNPVKSGRINGRDAFMCRGIIEGGLHIGYFIEGPGCNISYDAGVRILETFELLVR